MHQFWRRRRSTAPRTAAVRAGSRCLTQRCCPQLRDGVRAAHGRGPTSSWRAGCRTWKITRGLSPRRCGARARALVCHRHGSPAPHPHRGSYSLHARPYTRMPAHARCTLFTCDATHPLLQDEDEPFIAEKFATVTSESVSIRPARQHGLPAGSDAPGSERAAGAAIEQTVGVWDSGGWWGVEGAEEEGEEWVPGPSMTTRPRSFAAAAMANSTLFVIGGHDAKGACALRCALRPTPCTLHATSYALQPTPCLSVLSLWTTGCAMPARA